MKPGYKKVYFKSLESFNKWIAQGKLAYASDNFKFRMNKGVVQYNYCIGGLSKSNWLESISYLGNQDFFFKLTPLYKYVKINEKKNLSTSSSVSNRSRD